jgi:hypothetical protein
VGGALGLAILVTVFGRADHAATRHPVPGPGSVVRVHQILTHAMASSFGTAAIFDLCALLVIVLAIRMQLRTPAMRPAATARQPTED